MSSVIFNPHLERIACAKVLPWSTYANEPPVGQLHPASCAMINFTVGLLSAVADSELLLPTLFGTGGDEVIV